MYVSAAATNDRGGTALFNAGAAGTLGTGSTLDSGGAVGPGGAVGAGTVTSEVALIEVTSAVRDGTVLAGTLGTATLGVRGTVVAASPDDDAGAIPLTGWATGADVDDANLWTAAAERWPVGA